MRSIFDAPGTTATPGGPLRALPEYVKNAELDAPLLIADDVNAQPRLEKELALCRRQLRRLSEEREQRVEAERQQLARELHDELGQNLTALRMMAKLLPIRFGADVPQLDPYAQEMAELVDRTIGVMRGMVKSLRPPPIDMGLAAALEWLVDEFQRHNHSVCRLVVRLGDGQPSEPLTVALFRIVQESLTNISRHSGATQVQVLCRVRHTCWELQVSDNGSGFDIRQPHLQSFGLLGMRERVLAFDGQLELNSTVGHGTRVSVRIPLAAAKRSSSPAR